MNKTAIFVIGEEKSGKGSIIRALTGCGARGAWEVIALNGRRIKAFIVISSLQENKETKLIAPNEFPEAIGYKNEELLICPLEIRAKKGLYNFNEYLNVCIKKKFEVKVAVIKNPWNCKPTNIDKVEEYMLQNKLENVILHICDSDAHTQSRIIRDMLYPRY
ncbi:MAG: hypothetical protein D4R88_06750 [Methanosarcinales archaeon]|nr:MAG: hypothetical protein D4R88_06750 [Methanosarcinales archaeon]